MTDGTVWRAACSALAVSARPVVIVSRPTSPGTGANTRRVRYGTLAFAERTERVDSGRTPRRDPTGD